MERKERICQLYCLHPQFSSCVWDVKSQLDDQLFLRDLVLLGVSSFVPTRGTATFLPSTGTATVTWARASETTEASVQTAHDSRES